MSTAIHPPIPGKTTVLSVTAKARLTRELARLQTDPPPGIAAYLESDDDMSRWKAEIVGPEDSPFADTVFYVSLQIPARYPFEPPACRFISDPAPYHPNIDANGRICLDTLKSPPAGSWSPAVSLPSLLLSLRSLLADPNPDDGLVPEISNLYKYHPEKWKAEARKRSQQQKSTLATSMTGKREFPPEAVSEVKEGNEVDSPSSTSPNFKRHKEA